jgi:two-component system response regulator NreC
LYPSLAKTLAQDYLTRMEAGEEKPPDGLTEREREVLKLIADGWSNQEVAQKLVISVKTVERRRANIFAKLNLHSRTELVKYAIRKGLIEVES